MIIFDTETTGLPKKKNQPMDEHPEIVEFAAIKVDFNTLERIDSMEFLCKPMRPSDEGAFKTHGITEEMLKDEKPFKAHYLWLAKFFLGARYLAAHNVNFDEYMLWTEFTRMDKITKFPWPPERICTVEKSMSIQNGKRSKLDFLVEHYLGIKKRKGSHRAMKDVEDLYEVIKCMRADNLL